MFNDLKAWNLAEKLVHVYVHQNKTIFLGHTQLKLVT